MILSGFGFALFQIFRNEAKTIFALFSIQFCDTQLALNGIAENIYRQFTRPQEEFMRLKLF